MVAPPHRGLGRHAHRGVLPERFLRRSGAGRRPPGVAAAQHVPGRRLVLRAQHHRDQARPARHDRERAGSGDPGRRLCARRRASRYGPPEIDPVFIVRLFRGQRSAAGGTGRGRGRTLHNQVVPAPHDNSVPVVAAYREALAGYDPDASPGYVSLEGYLAGRLAVAGLEACGRTASRRLLPGRLSHRQRLRYRRFRAQLRSRRQSGFGCGVCDCDRRGRRAASGR